MVPAGVLGAGVVVVAGAVVGIGVVAGVTVSASSPTVILLPDRSVLLFTPDVLAAVALGLFNHSQQAAFELITGRSS